MLISKPLDYPSLHPAYDPSAPPAALEPYNPSTHDGNRCHSHLKYFDTTVGRVLRELNSTLGIPYDSYKALRILSYDCPGCGCVYSLDGFNEHIENGLCRNAPELMPGMFYHL